VDENASLTLGAALEEARQAAPAELQPEQAVNGQPDHEVPADHDSVPSGSLPLPAFLLQVLRLK
jgi:hypothetical protein